MLTDSFSSVCSKEPTHILLLKNTLNEQANDKKQLQEEMSDSGDAGGSDQLPGYAVPETLMRLRKIPGTFPLSSVSTSE